MPIPILAYHLVTDNIDLGLTRVSIKQFKRQMAWLAENGYTTLTLAEYTQKKQLGTEQLGQKKIVLTFDDAYASLSNAYEIMSRYGFVGTCFAISDFIGKQNNWDYQFFVRKINHADSDFLQNLVASGWEIGSHSRRHTYLPDLSDEELYDELNKSKEKIAGITSKDVVSISYPFGYTDERICSIAKLTGYEAGVGLGISLYKQLSYKNLCLPRLGIYLFDSTRSFINKINAFSPYRRSSFSLQQILSFGSRGTLLLKKFRTLNHMASLK